MLRRVYFSLLMVSLSTVAPACWGESREDVVVEHGVTMKTRDGVTLRADIYRPAGEGAFPVLLQRTPYDKTGGETFGRRAAGRGSIARGSASTNGQELREGDGAAVQNENAIEFVAGDAGAEVLVFDLA